MIMYGIWIYKNADTDDKKLLSLIDKIPDKQCDTCIVYQDTARDHLAYQKLKQEIAGKEGFLLLNNLRSLGGTKESISAELQWIKNQSFCLIIADCPESHCYTPHDNHLVIGGMIDALASFADVKLVERSVNKGGRPMVKYPKGWEQLYEQWQNGEITATEFMKRAGLKKGTFYHLAVEYKETIASIRQIRKIC